jgi:peptidylprolyl isomerase
MLAFAGCSGEPSDEPSSPTDTSTTDALEWEPLTSLDQITVSDTELGIEPSVEFEKMIKADSTLISTLIEGSGTVVQPPGIIGIYYAGYNTRDGVRFDGNFDKTASAVSSSGFIAGFNKALDGQKIGSRVLVAIASEDGYASGNADAGILAGDTLVFVIDIIDGQYYEPVGTLVAEGNEYATVTFDNGVPIPQALPDIAAPADTVSTVLIPGDVTRTVAESDYVVVNYVEVNYATGEVLSGTYGGDSVMIKLASMIPGWRNGLLGQAMGSRLLLVVPPADAYPDGDSSRELPAGQTLLYVVDVLYVVASG